MVGSHRKKISTKAYLFRFMSPFVASLLLSCSVGDNPRWYDLYPDWVDSGLDQRDRVLAMPVTSVDQFPTTGSARFSGWFLGTLSGCPFGNSCSGENAAYGTASMNVDFGGPSASLQTNSMNVRYSNGGTYINLVRPMTGDIDISGSAISGRIDSWVPPGYYTNPYHGQGTVNGAFRGDGPDGAMLTFNGTLEAETQPTVGLTGVITLEAQ
jgi:hypothetical protein